MAIFTVHVPPRVANATKRADGTIFVRDRFNWPAFLFGPLFLLYRRLWLAALAWVGLSVLLGLVSHALQLSPGDAGILVLLLSLLTGLEAASLRQWSLDRRGYILAGLLSSPSQEEAERAFFGGDDLRQGSARPAIAGPPSRSGDSGNAVIGLFPQAGDAG